MKHLAHLGVPNHKSVKKITFIHLDKNGFDNKSQKPKGELKHDEGITFGDAHLLPWLAHILSLV